MNNSINTSSEKQNKLKKTLRNWIIASTLLLTLASQPAEAKTTEKNINTTEFVSAQNAEKAEWIIITDYIWMAEKEVNNYYPERCSYFSELIKEFKNAGEYYNNAFNIIVEEEIYNDEIKWKISSKKDIITTILYTLDGFSNTKKFLNEKSIRIIDPEEWEDIRRSTWRIATKRIQRTINNLNEKLKKSNDILREIDIEELPPEKIITCIENCFMKIFETKDLKYWSKLQNRIKIYISLNKRLGKEPSELWKQRVKEFEKINN